MDQERTVKRVLFWMEDEGLIVKRKKERVREYLRELTALSFWEGTRHYGESNSLRIIQYDREMNEIERFDNQLIAARMVGYTDRTISRALKTGKKTRAGHYWKYADDEKGDNRDTDTGREG